MKLYCVGDLAHSFFDRIVLYVYFLFIYHYGICRRIAYEGNRYMVNGRQRLTHVKDASTSCCENRDGGATSVAIRRSLGRRLLPTLLASSLVLCLMAAVAQANDQPESETKVTVAEPPNQDLLLFWEEKELYVQTATRTAKPISQVAENMVVVTAKDIADMNARNVAEVLRRHCCPIVNT